MMESPMEDRSGSSSPLSARNMTTGPTQQLPAACPMSSSRSNPFSIDYILSNVKQQQQANHESFLSQLSLANKSTELGHAERFLPTMAAAPQLPPPTQPAQLLPSPKQQTSSQQNQNFIYFMAYMLLQQQQQQQQQQKQHQHQQAAAEQALRQHQQQQRQHMQVQQTQPPMTPIEILAQLTANASGGGGSAQPQAPLASIAGQLKQSPPQLNVPNYSLPQPPPGASAAPLGPMAPLYPVLQHHQQQLPSCRPFDRLQPLHRQQPQEKVHCNGSPVVKSPKSPGKLVSSSVQQQQQTTGCSASRTSSSSDKLDNLKPAHSYIGLIGMCILSTPEKRMVLNDIYQYILDHYPYYRNRGSGWRNSVRHNLSLNECFQKAGRAANGKGHYWTIHPANMDDFMNGDFRRRRAQRKVRRWNNMDVPSDESDDESTEDANRPPLPEHFKRSLDMHRRLEAMGYRIHLQHPGMAMAAVLQQQQPAAATASQTCDKLLGSSEFVRAAAAIAAAAAHQQQTQSQPSDEAMELSP